MTLEPNTFEQRFPDIDWRKPLPVTVIGREIGYACRICVGLHGLRGDDKLFATAEACQAHINQHPR